MRPSKNNNEENVIAPLEFVAVILPLNQNKRRSQKIQPVQRTAPGSRYICRKMWDVPEEF